MKIGYPCLNRSLDCRVNQGFRLANLEPKRLTETIAANLKCLESMIRFNTAHGLLFLRISSDLIPFGSHAANRIDWRSQFRDHLSGLDDLLKQNQFRISMHPGQYTLLNSPSEEVVTNSVRDLNYHADVLDLLGLDASAKIQLHIGGRYGDPAAALKRFVVNFNNLEERVRRRLVIENDERLYALADVIAVYERTGAPVLFDVFHHSVLNRGESLHQALEISRKTWRAADGLPMVDYSSQLIDGKIGAHAQHLDEGHFVEFLNASRPYNFDLMLEIKDKETSALRALKVAAADTRLVC